MQTGQISRAIYQGIYARPDLGAPRGGDRVTLNGSEAPGLLPSLRSMHRGVLGQGLHVTPGGALEIKDPALAAYAKAIGLAAGNLQTAMAVASTTLTPAGASALDIANRSFTAPEMLQANAGYYHSPSHPLNVAGAVGEVARGLGRPQPRVEFLQQVALMHDFDERFDMTADATPAKIGSAARVQVTLQWMDQNQQSLQSRFNWSDTDFREAKTLIARTDFPFDTKARNCGTAYDGQSPRQVHEDLLAGLPPDRQAAAMEDGLLLSFSDQIGNYVGSRAQAESTVRGLAHEIGAPEAALLKGSAAFQRTVGADFAADTEVAARLGITALLPTAERLEAALSPASRANLYDNRAMFEALART